MKNSWLRYALIFAINEGAAIAASLVANDTGLNDVQKQALEKCVADAAAVATAFGS